MIESDVNICNLALDMLNQANITSLDENTKTSKVCKRWYDITRRTLLTNLNASFSITRAALTKVADYKAVWGYKNAYMLPKDCLQVLNLANPLDDELYQIEGKYFYCNKNNELVEIRYIKDEKDVSMFDSEFIELFAIALAEALAIPLCEDISKKNMLRQLRKEKYIECSTKYGRDNRITVINKPRYREAKIFAEIENYNYPLQ